KLVVSRDECYGCGMCVEACSLEAISLGARK
ncbi:MAG TPA: ferredoxin, partial [candidate division Zixibacteria bacterium]|nr:ferredoxin [candidate division Zixibacteria bacterium]